MKIQILGGHGGLAKGFGMTSILIDQKLLIDAGAVASRLSVAEQAAIDDILISHCRLDHIKDLAFISDNCFGMKKTPFKVHAHPSVIKIIKDHLLNDIVWPDFTKLPSPEKPTLMYVPLIPERTISLGEYKVTPVPVNHPFDAMGYVIEKEGSAVLFTLDTGPTERIWEIARDIKKLKAIFTEVSFPNALQRVATVSQHHTPKTLQEELKQMPKSIPVILTHLKPNYRDEIMKEIKALGEPRIQVLQADGDTFNF